MEEWESLKSLRSDLAAQTLVIIDLIKNLEKYHDWTSETNHSVMASLDELIQVYESECHPEIDKASFACDAVFSLGLTRGALQDSVEYDPTNAAYKHTLAIYVKKYETESTLLGVVQKQLDFWRDAR